MWLICWGRLSSPPAASSQVIPPAHSRAASHHHAANSASASETGHRLPALLYVLEAMPDSRRDGSGEPGKPGQILEQGWRGPKHEAAVAAFPPVPDPAVPSPRGCRADGRKHARGSINHLQKQDDNPVPFFWVLGRALAARRVQTGAGTSTGRCFAAPSLAQPFPLFSSSRLIIKSSCWLQISVSRQTRQQSRRFCEPGGIFIHLRMASRGTPSVTQIYYFFPFLPIVSVFAARTVP